MTTGTTAPTISSLNGNVSQTLETLRARLAPPSNVRGEPRQRRGLTRARRIERLRELGELWQARLSAHWEPPTAYAVSAPFPFAQTRRGVVSLVEYLTGLRAQDRWIFEARENRKARRLSKPGVVALILAGNTPLAGWQPLLTILLAGHAVFVKLSRDETFWIPALFESIAELSPAFARRIHVATFAGDSDETIELCRNADAVVAYGSDESIAALRAQTPAATPFFGFGHAISIGIVKPNYGRMFDLLPGFAYDTLLYNQSGCLSPQTIFVVADDGIGGNRLMEQIVPIAWRIEDTMPEAARELDVKPVRDTATAARIRTARDEALFDGAQILSDADELRWTVAVYPNFVEQMPTPVGLGFLSVVPIGTLSELPERLGATYVGKISAAGVCGNTKKTTRDVLASVGVSLFTNPGAMQTPPLHWPNGGVDLLAALWVR